MSAIAAEPSPPRLQPLLFADLPETARRRPPRRTRSTPAESDAVVGEPPPPSFPAAIPSPAPVAPPAAPPDPAEMSQAELRALAAALPDAKLAFLLLESARETRRRLAPPAVDLDFDPGDAPPEPNTALLRAAATAVGELSGEDDSGGNYAATRSPGKRGGGRSR